MTHWVSLSTQKNMGESQCASVQIEMDVLHQCPGMLCSFQKKIRIQWKLSAFLQHQGCGCPGLISLGQGSSAWAPSPVSQLSSCTILRKEQSAPKQGQGWQHSHVFPGALDPVLPENAQGGTFDGFYAKLKTTATQICCICPEAQGGIQPWQVSSWIPGNGTQRDLLRAELHS